MAHRGARGFGVTEAERLLALPPETICRGAEIPSHLTQAFLSAGGRTPWSQSCRHSHPVFPSRGVSVRGEREAVAVRKHGAVRCTCFTTASPVEMLQRPPLPVCMAPFV